MVRNMCTFTRVFLSFDSVDKDRKWDNTAHEKYAIFKLRKV